jgi:uncharacterized repeat protein (TIGR01451 family)
MGHTRKDTPERIGFARSGGRGVSIAAAVLTLGVAVMLMPQAALATTASISIVNKADATSVPPGGAIGFTVTIVNTGTATDNSLTLTDPLPAGSPGVNWTIDTTVDTPDDFTITGSAGSQSLVFSPALIGFGDSLALGQSISVHITASTSSTECSTFQNTATISTANAGSATSTASVHVCASQNAQGNDNSSGNEPQG